ncbi:MAG: glycosyltransferase [Pseudomonadota bacterium]
MSKVETLGFVIPSLSAGGAERVVACLAEGLAAEFDCIVFIKPGAHRHYDADKFRVFEVPYTKKDLRAAFEKYSVDLIFDHYHWQADHVREMSELADEGFKIALTEHNAYHYPLFQFVRDRLDGYDQWFEERYAHYQKFAAVTVLNEDARALFSQHLDNVRHIPNPAPLSAREHRHENAKTVLNISHFSKPAKRLDLLYQAHAQVRAAHPDCQLRIVGDYDWSRDRYLRRVNGLEDADIRCVGRSRMVGEHYAQASVFAMTSEIEGQPMVLLEAALHEAPQVAFDLPGLRDQIVEGETGHLVPFGDVEGFAARVNALLADPERRRRMGSASRALVEEAFSVRRVLESWRALITEISAHGRVRAERAAPAPDLVALSEQWSGYWTNPERLRAPGTPKISFLVPVYGTEDVLGRCLRSIQNQTLTEFECLVVDDASPGDVAAVVRETVGADPRFRVLKHERNRGLYQARSTAADAANGLYFSNIDSDDYIHPNFAEILFDEALITGAEIVECQAVELHEDGRPIHFNTIHHPGPNDGDAARKAYFNGSLRNVVWNKIYSRDLWRRRSEHNQIDVGLSVTEDTLRNSFLFPDCQLYSAVEDCLYFYCRRGTSVVKGGGLDRFAAKMRDIENSFDRAQAHVREIGDPHAYRALGSKRLFDVRWYTEEFLGRHSYERVLSEIEAEPEKYRSLGLVLGLVRESMRLDRERDHYYRAWRWEKDRADRLERATPTWMRQAGTLLKKPIAKVMWRK